MFTELIKKFGAEPTVALLFLGGIWFLFWHLFTKVEKKLDEQSNKFEQLLASVVTRGECDRKHDSLMAIFTSMMNCRNCGRSNNSDSKVA